MNRSHQQDDDQSIIEGLTISDPAAIKRAYHSLHQRLYPYVLSNSGDADDAQHLVSDTLLILITKAQNGGIWLKPGVRFIHFAFSIGRNQWHNELKKRKRRNDRMPTTDLYSGTNEDGTPRLIPVKSDEAKPGDNLDPSLDKCLERILERALAQLNDVDQRIMELRYFKKMRLKDVAVELGLTEGNAKVRHKRAVERLYRTMQADPEYSVCLENQ